MKKRLAAMVLAVLLVLSISVCAAELRYTSIYPSLTFSGTTANCGANIEADNSTDTISAIITLKQGSTVIKNWTSSGVGELNFRKTAAVAKGGTYTLVVNAKVAGVALNAVSTTATCP